MELVGARLEVPPGAVARDGSVALRDGSELPPLRGVMDNVSPGSGFEVTPLGQPVRTPPGQKW